jgi:uncharacterized protein
VSPSLVLSPTQAKERLASLDIIRGVAVLGILTINIAEFGMPMAASIDPTVYGGAEGINLWTWIFTAMFLEGTQRGLFTLLFGAGVILFTERMESSGRSNAVDLYFRRNLWLVVFGLVHGFLLLWMGEILFAYGVIALFVFTFRRATPATLIWIAMGGLAVNAIWSEYDIYGGLQAHEAWQKAIVVQESGASLRPEQAKAIDAWEAIVTKYKPSEEEINKAIEASRGSYFQQVAYQAPIRSELQNSFVYRYFFDMFSMMLIGMAFFKSGLLDVGRQRGAYWKMLLFGYALGLTVNFFETRHLLAENFSALAQLQTRVTYDIGRLAMTTGHVGLLLLLCSSTILTGLKRRLAAVGRMAFTNYISQSVICAFVFFGIGFGLFGHLERYQLYFVLLGIWAFQLLVSPIWLSHYYYGPLEWVWRSLTYGRRQPMRRAASVSVVPTPST